MGTKNNPGKFDCYAKAEPNEPLFVLLARDEMAPVLVRAWAGMQQAKLGLNPDLAFSKEGRRLREKIDEALACVRMMEDWQRGIPR